MTPQQSRMARAGLKWSLDDLAEAAGVGRATVARFEGGQTVEAGSVSALREAMQKAGAHFIETGPFAGAVQMRLKGA